MLESVKIQRRQSEIRSALAAIVGKATPSEDETRQMETLDLEYRSNETRYRAALIAEDTERREAGRDLETAETREKAKLKDKFEVRQVIAALDDGRALSGETAELVQEMRSHGSYRGVPIPLEALEMRSGETVASGVYDPVKTMPVIDRLFPDSVMAKMGGALISIDSGSNEYPVTSSAIAAGWLDGETAVPAAPQQFTTADKVLAPDQNLAVQVFLTRKTLKQATGIEQAVRRDLNGAISAELDKAAFLGAGSSGEPLGVVTGYSTYGITNTSVGANASWAAFRAAVTRFMLANAAGGPGAVKLMIRPEVWDMMDGSYIDVSSGITEWDRLLKNIPMSNIVMTSNALDVPGGSPDKGNTTALLSTTAGGVPPFMVGTWGGVDLIRDPYGSPGHLKITAVLTADVQVLRDDQLEILSNVETK